MIAPYTIACAANPVFESTPVINTTVREAR